jgi:2Fe-2S ferredoxin
VSEADAATVTVLPRGVTVTVAPGQSVFEAAVQQDVQWPTTCEGMGTCRLCFMSLVEGDEHVNPVESFEAEGLEEVVDNAQRGELRLACQVRPSGDLVVFKRGVRLRTRT